MGGSCWQLGCHICVRGQGAQWRPPLMSEHLQLSALLSLSCCPLPSLLHSGSHPLSTSLVMPSLCVVAPSSQKAERKEGKSEQGGEIMRARGRLAMGQIGSQLSVRPFITHLWLCAHLHRRVHIQNYYCCLAYCCVCR